MLVRIYKLALYCILATSPLFAIDDFDPLTMTESPHYIVSTKNVGQGSCAIIKNLANNKFIIIDAGTSSDNAAKIKASSSISGFLGFSEISPDVPLSDNTITIIVSHSDKDHINLFKTSVRD